jgi:energy-coupling factor transporter ATP-binding protein EcfA2
VSNPYRLESITLHEVGVFDDLRIDFKPIESEAADAKKAEIHLFTGGNGCGKSTVLYALAGIYQHSAERGLFRTRARTKEAYVEYDLPSVATFGSLKYTSDTPDPTGGSVMSQLSITPLDTHKARTKLKTPFYPLIRFDFATFAYSGQRTLQQTQLTTIQQINNSPFEDALSFDKSVRPQVLLQWIANNRTQSALANADGDTQAATNYDFSLTRITNFIQEVCGLEIAFRLERSPLAVTLRINGENVQFDGLPDGLKSIISWVADLSLRLEAIPWEKEGDVFTQPIILFLDEIDIHLHPKWQRRILPAVQKLLPNAQIFASTHSPFVVGSVEDAWIYKLPDPVQGHTTEKEVVGIKSGAGQSYRLILEEIFGINEEFDVETESLFDQFYAARDTVLKTNAGIETLLAAARTLTDRSEEARLIIARELRQISRLIGQEINLA